VFEGVKIKGGAVKLTPAKGDKSNFAKYYEHLAKSVSTLLVTIATLAAVYTYLAYEQQDSSRAASYLVGLDKLLAIREIARRTDFGSDQMTRRDLLDFFPAASRELYASNSDSDPHRVVFVEEKGFTSDPIERSLVVDVMSRLSQRYCKASITRLMPGEKFNFATFQIVGKTYWVASENVQLVFFDGCFSGEGFGQPMLVLRSNRDIIIALPKFFEKEFPPIAPPPIFRSFRFYDYEKLSKLMPEEIRKFGDFSAPMVMIHLAAIEHYILRHAADREHRFYSPDEFEAAVSALYQAHEKTRMLFGINAPVSTFILIAPFVSFVLCFELWRRVRRVPTNVSETPIFWFAADAVDVIGLWTARMYAILPVVATAAMYGGFVIATGATFVSEMDLRRIFVLVRSGATPSEVLQWVPLNLAGTILLVLFPFHVTVAFESFRRLLFIAQSSYRAGGARYGMKGWQVARLRKRYRKNVWKL
jgi:hypothetical protein